MTHDIKAYLAAAHAAIQPASSGLSDRIDHVGVVGAGRMGAGIAIACLQSGIAVTLVDSSEAALENSRQKILSQIKSLVQRGKADEKLLAGLGQSLQSSQAYGALGACDLVIEAVAERIDVKLDVFRALSGLVQPGALLASNTSGLDIDRLAEASGRPGNFLGLHFFNPANIMPLLEIVRGARTSPEALARAVTFANQIGKVGLVVGNCFGFAANRSLSGYSREAGFLLLEGASPEEIDRAFQEFGFPMGPCAMADLAGHDIALDVVEAMQTQEATPHDPKVAAISRALVRAGRLGQKSGGGLYDYQEGSRQPRPSPAASEILTQQRLKLAIGPRKIPKAEIIERCLLPVINEGVRLLAEGILDRTSNLDLIWIYGYGFPAARGGPVSYADSLGLRTVVERLEHYQALSPYGDAYWRPHPLLKRLAAQGGALRHVSADTWRSTMEGAPP